MRRRTLQGLEIRCLRCKHIRVFPWPVIGKNCYPTHDPIENDLDVSCVLLAPNKAKR